MEYVKIEERHLNKEPKVGACDRFSTFIFTKRLAKGIMPCDYSPEDKLIEFELSDGDRVWLHFKDVFGEKVEAKDILLLYPNGKTENLLIVGVEAFKVKRSWYLKLILEKELPF